MAKTKRPTRKVKPPTLEGTLSYMVVAAGGSGSSLTSAAASASPASPTDPPAGRFPHSAE
jgi:hypothetical protein